MAFIEDLSPEGALQRTLQALRAVQIAFVAASLEAGAPHVDVVSFDTGGDAAGADDVAREIAEDPRYVAAIAAPDLCEGRVRLLPDILDVVGGRTPARSPPRPAASRSGPVFRRRCWILPAGRSASA